MEKIMFIGAMILGGIAIYLSIMGEKEYNEKEDLKKGVINLMKKLKPKQSITIHYGDEKQLTFIGGKLQ